MNPSAETEPPEITPQVVHLIDLLKWAKEGRLRVPKFQRDFVWRREDIVDLFDSVASQYPIGTLFLWGADPQPETTARIGPLVLPAYRGQIWLVLDGQQRLTSLVGVLLRASDQWSPDPDDDDPGRWSVYFDARAESGFTHFGEDGELPPSYIPVPSLLDTMKLFNEAERIMMFVREHPLELTETDAKAWIARAQDVARAIQGYRIPIVQFTTNDLSVAVESFSRLNKKGRTIGQDEMFSALTYQEGEGNRGFHLAGEIDQLQGAMIRDGFGEVDRTILLRAVLTAASLDMYRTDWSRLGQRLKADTRKALPDAVKEAARGLAAARRFLRDELGVANSRMLPYSMQLVALSAFFGRCATPTVEQKELMRQWFWVTSFSGWFGSNNPARVRRLVEEFRDDLPKRAQPKSLHNMDLAQPGLPTPSKFDLRSARVRTMLCVLFRCEPLRPDGSPFGAAEAARVLLERGPEAMGVVCATVSNPMLRKSPANRLLDVEPSSIGQAKNWLLKLADGVRDDVLTSHAIDPRSFDALKASKHDDFLRMRLQQIAQHERDFMQEMGVVPPTGELLTAPSPIDVDDSAPLSLEGEYGQLSLV